MCVISMTRVRGVIAAANASTISRGDVQGTGKEISFTIIPCRRARCFQPLIMRP